MRRMYDASTPPISPPKWEVVAGYIGGSTRHIWTDQEWEEQAQKSGAVFRLPIFVRIPPTIHNPTDDALETVAWLLNHQVPQDTCVVLDYETAVDPNYLARFDAAIKAHKYLTLLYGSIATVFKNPRPSGGYWVADWTRIPHLVPGSAATQWSGSGPFQGAYDPSLVADSTPLWQPGGDMFTDADRNKLNSLATHQDVITMIEGTPQRPASLETIFTAVQGIPDAVVAKIPPGTTNLTADQIKQAVIDGLREVLHNA